MNFSPSGSPLMVGVGCCDSVCCSLGTESITISAIGLVDQQVGWVYISEGASSYLLIALI
jgi:hypothetical protein